MIVVFEKSVLFNSLTPALGAVSTNNTVPAIEGVLLDCRNDGKCIISAYDTDKGMRTVIDAEILSHGICILNAVKLYQIVRNMPGNTVKISVDEKYKATIESGVSNFELKALPGEEFPVMPELGGESGFIIPQFIFRRFINKCSFAVAINDQRPAFNGMYFRISGNNITVVACDGNRLILCEKVCELENRNRDGSELDLEFIIPGRTLYEVIKLIKDTEDEMEIRLTRKHVIFKIGTIVFFSKLIDTDYIDYNRIIPKSCKTEINLKAEELREALERASLITEDRLAGSIRAYVKLTLEGENLKISSVSANGSSLDEFRVKKEGDDIIIGFNCKFLLDAMKSCSDGNIKICLTSPLTGISIEPTENDDGCKYLYFVMPLRMNN